MSTDTDIVERLGNVPHRLSMEVWALRAEAAYEILALRSQLEAMKGVVERTLTAVADELAGYKPVPGTFGKCSNEVAANIAIRMAVELLQERARSELAKLEQKP